MATKMVVAVRISAEDYEKLKQAALNDHRTIPNYVAFKVMRLIDYWIVTDEVNREKWKAESLAWHRGQYDSDQTVQ